MMRGCECIIIIAIGEVVIYSRKWVTIGNCASSNRLIYIWIRLGLFFQEPAPSEYTSVYEISFWELLLNLKEENFKLLVKGNQNSDSANSVMRLALTHHFGTFMKKFIEHNTRMKKEQDLSNKEII